MHLIDPDGEVFKSFTVGCHVILQNLVGGANYNGKRAIVNSPVSSSGRQQVYIVEYDKVIAVKPVNLRYEPLEVSSLSVEEMKRMLKGPSPKGVAVEQMNVLMPGVGSLLAAKLLGDTSLLEIECANEESLTSMVVDLLQSYSVDLATFLAILRRKEQDDAIRYGTWQLMKIPGMIPELDRRSPGLKRRVLVPHHERCTEAEIDYIIQRQLYFLEHPAELLCMSPERMTPLRILNLYEKANVCKDSSTCRFCGKMETMDKEFPECAGCGLVTYCSKKCQKADWKRHKQICTKVNDSKKRTTRKLDKRVDQFIRLYGPLVQSALVDKFAKLAKEEKVDAEIICKTNIASIELIDLPTNTATRPYLHLSRIAIYEQSYLSRDEKSLISHANKRQEGKLLFHYNVVHEGYDGKSVFYAFSADLEFKNLVQYCTREELSTSEVCKVHAINAIAAGDNPVLHRAIKKAVETKEKKSAANRNKHEK